MRYLAFSLGIAVLVAIPDVASAQMGPGMGGPMGPGMGGPTAPAGEEKKEGVAEAAPKTPGLLPTTPALPPPKGRRKRWKLLELDGYYRLRTDWMKDFNLGFNDNPALGGAPFPRALGCTSMATNHPCNDSLASTNMRLRLEPTINIDEGTSVHVQADVLDNLILGSTPTGMDLSPNAYTAANPPPLGAFQSVQSPPVVGLNSDRNSIAIKRAWGEVAVPLGILTFGRMPNQWGMGMYHNAGGRDDINGTYDYDADYGDTVDRVAFSALIPGTPLRAMVAADWDTTRLVSNQVPTANKGNEGHPFDLDDSDDTNGYVGVISKMESPQEFRDAVDRGEDVFDYGIYFEYKTQSWDDNLTGYQGVVNPANPGFNSSTQYVPRDMTTYTADLWGKAGLGSIQLEGEFVAQLGDINSLMDYGIMGSVSIRKFGGVGRFTWTGVDGKLRLGLESGFATGDQWDNTPQGNTNIAFGNPLGVGNQVSELTQFIFNRDYKIDYIMWRHLFGAVTNAVYGKPFLQYDLTKGIMFKVANVTSFALKPVATPGNSVMYGTEFDGDLGYTNGRLYAGFSYGVLFPFGAMSHPEDVTAEGGKGFGYSSDPANLNTGDASTAHIIMTRLVLAF